MKGTILRVGFLLGLRQIQRANIWTTLLIIFIMMLTFLNLVAVSGILVGLIEGSVRANRDQNTGDVFLSTLVGKEYIEESQTVLSTVATIPGIKNYSARYTQGVSVEANYRTRRDPQEVRDTAGSAVVGIDPVAENAVTKLSNYVVEGEYLQPGDENILIGSNLLVEYSTDFGDAFATLEGVRPGTRVRLTVGDRTKEYIVKGIVDSKVGETSMRIFMTESEFERLVGRTNKNVNEVAITIADGADETAVKTALVDSGIADHARVRISREALPQALEDIMTTFGILGNAISAIGLMVSSITIFIVIFINAVTRRKYIGILKGIGVNEKVIELSYIMQSIFYAVIGSGLGTIVVYAVLVPLMNAHPIDFPFSDGILVAPVGGTIIKIIILLITTILAGFIPARLIVRRNTLDSILGR